MIQSNLSEYWFLALNKYFKPQNVVVRCFEPFLACHIVNINIILAYTTTTINFTYNPVPINTFNVKISHVLPFNCAHTAQCYKVFNCHEFLVFLWVLNDSIQHCHASSLYCHALTCDILCTNNAYETITIWKSTCELFSQLFTIQIRTCLVSQLIKLLCHICTVLIKLCMYWND